MDDRQVVMVTGAAGALGSATVEALQAAGARVIAVDVRLEWLQARFGDRPDLLCLAADLTDEESVAQAVTAAGRQFGRLDGLVNIAGGFSMGPRLHELDAATWDDLFNLNLRSVYLTCKHALAQMVTQETGGQIVNIGAYAAMQRGKQGMAPYVLSKHAVARLTEVLADEYRQRGVNVNCILPGIIDTPRNRADMPAADFSRWTTPAELAAVILFLLSPAARPIHGAVIPAIGRSQ